MEIYISGAGLEARQASLMTALSQAREGDVIKLSGGDYGDLSLKNLNVGNITIESQDAGNPAVFNSIRVVSSSDLTFSGLSVQLTPTESSRSWDNAVYIGKSTSITFKDSNVEAGPAINGVDPSAKAGDASGNVLGFPTGRGVYVVDSKDVDITGNNMGQLSKGVVLNNVVDVNIVGNEIHDIRTHIIAGTMVDGVNIENNYLHDVTPWNWGSGDHADFIQFWPTANVQKDPNNNIRIVGNHLNQGNGEAVLGIYLDDNGHGVGYTNIYIGDNTIVNNNAQGIRVEKADATIVGNTLINLSETDYHGYPGILALFGSQVRVDDNIVTRITVDGNSTIGESGNQTTGNGILDASTILMPIVSGLMPSKNPPTSPASPTSPTSPSVEAPVVDTPNEVPGNTPDDDVKVSPGGSDGVVGGAAGGEAPDIGHGDVGNLVTLTGTEGNDSLNDRGVASSLVGSGGDDKYVVSHAGTVVVESDGGGTDLVMSSVDFVLSAGVEKLNLLGEAHVGVGNALDNEIKGNGLDNVLYGLDGNDSLYGGGGHDFLYGGNGADYIRGDDGNDYLDGGAGNDTLLGGAGNDILVGGDGDDRLTGGLGADILSGGAGADRFIFLAGDLHGPSERDWITDFSRAEGDRIALNGIDANVHTAEDDKFAFIGQNAFSGHAGELRYDIVDGQTLIYGDTDGDRQADIYLGLTNAVILSSSDFIL